MRGTSRAAPARPRAGGPAQSASVSGLADLVLAWYPAAARDLPWRHRETTPWGVLVSEFMLQQTPVPRVGPVWQEWLTRWPRPSALAAAARAV